MWHQMTDTPQKCGWYWVANVQFTTRAQVIVAAYEPIGHRYYDGAEWTGPQDWKVWREAG
jgi:hypothetical protein